MALSKKLPIVSESEFLQLISQVSEFKSPTGKRYKVQRITADTLYFLRLDAKSGITENLNLKDLYRAYKEISHFTTESFRPFLPRKHSPARALLLKMGLISI